jgi:hypothetical protein
VFRQVRSKESCLLPIAGLQVGAQGALLCINSLRIGSLIWHHLLSTACRGSGSGRCKPAPQLVQEGLKLYVLDVAGPAGPTPEDSALAVPAVAELKILGAVVCLVPVDVVDRFVGLGPPT